MPKIEKLTRVTVEKIQVEKRTDFTTPFAGLTLRASPKQKVWTYRYRVRAWVDGKEVIRQRRLELGTFPAMGPEEARVAVGKARAQKVEGYDPQAERRRRRKSMTFLAVAWDWLEGKDDLKSKDRYRKMIAKDLVPSPLADLRIGDVEQADIYQVLKAIHERAPMQVNTYHSIIKQIFDHAVSSGLIRFTPMQGMKRLGKKAKRKRLLKPEEIAVIWSGLEAQGDTPASLAMRVHLLTGQRSGEIRQARIGDLFGRWLYIDPENTKKDRRHRIWLSDPAYQLVKRAIGNRTTLTDAIFTATPSGEPISKETYRRAARCIEGVEDWRPHDFRHMLITWLYGHHGRRKIVEPVIWAMFSHKGPGQVSRDVYAHTSFEAERQTWFEAWGDQLARIVDGDYHAEIISLAVSEHVLAL